MIEKFTLEELETIRRELAELPTGKAKRTLCHDAVHAVSMLFRKKHGEVHFTDSPKFTATGDVVDAMFYITDHTLCNYEKKHNKPKLYRSGLVPPELQKDYSAMMDELADVIRKYNRPM